MIQTASMIDVMNDLEEKKKVGWMIPETVADAFDALCETMANGKEKWVVLSACMIAFMEMDERHKSDAIAKAHAQKAAGRRFRDSERELEKLLNLTRSQVRTRIQRLARIFEEAGLSPNSDD